MVRGERAQLLLISSVLIALVIVASAMFINGLMVPETAQSQAVSDEADDVSDTSFTLRNDLQELFWQTNLDEYDMAFPYARSPDLMQNVSAYNGRAFTMDAWSSGSISNLSLNVPNSAKGLALLQPENRSMTAADGNESWTMATDVNQIHTFWLNVSEQPTGEARIVINQTGSPTSTEWFLALEDDIVRIDGPSTSRTLCDGGDVDSVLVSGELLPQRNATVSVTGGASCDNPSFEFGGDLASSRPWNISVVRGDFLSNTTYAVTTDGSFTGNYGPGPDEPTFEQDVIVNPAFELRHVSPRFNYTSTFRLLNRTGQ